MALLKKGSKGKEVEGLQSSLNKLGAKPELKIDGQFGPLTDKALRKAQTKLKLEKVDGKAGDYTMAAIKHGKPLPKMEVRDLSKDATEHKLVRKHNETMIALYDSIAGDIDMLDKVLEQYASAMKHALSCTKGPREQAASVAADLARVQRDYEKFLLTNPAAAEKCAQAVESGYPKYDSLFDELERAMKDISEVSSGFKSQLKTATDKIDAKIAKMGKQVDATIKAQKKLMNS